jgi:hypothetical protein
MTVGGQFSFGSIRGADHSLVTGSSYRHLFSISRTRAAQVLIPPWPLMNALSYKAIGAVWCGVLWYH